MSNLDLAQFGKPRSVVSSDPAANTDVTITIPTGPNLKYLLLAASVTVVQGATQTPLTSLVVKDAAGNTLFTAPGASAATSVSTTTTYTWYPGATFTAGAGATLNTSPIPSGLLLKGGWTVSTSTAGKGANTDLGVLALWVITL